MPRKTKSVVSSSIEGNDIAASSTITNSTSQIHRLPLEVRMIIYAFVFGDRIVDVHQRNGACRFPKRDWFVMSSRSRPKTRKAVQALENFRTNPSSLAIAGTCRQFYEEAVIVWYQNVQFFFYSKQCMMQFLDDIGASNWLSIRHVGVSGRLGPDDEVAREISYEMHTLASLRTLTFEDVGNSRNMEDRYMWMYTNREYMEAAKLLLGWWEEEAEDWLRHRERLESVFIKAKTLNTQVEYNNQCRFKSIWTLESRELKLDKCTGAIVTKTSQVDRENTEGVTRRVDICTRGIHSSVSRVILG
jgi:hypothetical protein